MTASSYGVAGATGTVLMPAPRQGPGRTRKAVSASRGNLLSALAEGDPSQACPGVSRPVVSIGISKISYRRRLPARLPGVRAVPGEGPVRLCAAHGDWLHELAARFQIVWATGWGVEANRVLAPRRLLLPELPVISFRRSRLIRGRNYLLSSTSLGKATGLGG
jgi:hypothetical protein